MENSSEPFRSLECDVFLPMCPASMVLGLLAEKWALLVIHALSEKTYRTAELRRRIGGISEKMLIQALKKLEKHGLVSRRSYPEVPPRVEYSLTRLGLSLSGVVRELDRWVEEHALEIADWAAQPAKAADGAVPARAPA
ncbi:helix-turn-helix domain-containing protein [Telmatospirillum sp.]|uniref:winged helix-turn-helix transcriptional regulator n=1 Tax=Telmatospirillum sp. TaxID=2079197 RepID=UPI0028517236|nr:helix-turn-helix domain-containing protein [Telmatospirillum sp.]MDR3438734.1 helix-turn-helix domain-containing protein [Telmatospirillum sp.]